jgi:hypothetical protein
MHSYVTGFQRARNLKAKINQGISGEFVDTGLTFPSAAFRVAESVSLMEMKTCFTPANALPDEVGLLRAFAGRPLLALAGVTWGGRTTRQERTGFSC